MLPFIIPSGYVILYAAKTALRASARLILQTDFHHFGHLNLSDNDAP